MSKISKTKVYSAREAFQYVKKIFLTDSAFRHFLREDISNKNIFNAKLYTIGKQPRFVIKGSDLLNAIVTLKK